MESLWFNQVMEQKVCMLDGDHSGLSLSSICCARHEIVGEFGRQQVLVAQQLSEPLGELNLRPIKGGKLFSGLIGICSSSGRSARRHR